jgi:6-phosphofructokinase 1
VRLVDVHSTRYAIARRYMIRLRREDFDDRHDLAKLAAIAHCSADEFRDRYAYLTQDEPNLPVDPAGMAAAQRQG